MTSDDGARDRQFQIDEEIRARYRYEVEDEVNAVRDYKTADELAEYREKLESELREKVQAMV